MPFVTPPPTGIRPGALAANQQQQQHSGVMTPEDANLTQQVQSLPEYQAYMGVLTQPGVHTELPALRQALMARIQALGIPDLSTFDPYTGQIREKSWIERHPTAFNLLVTAGIVGGSLGGAALTGGIGTTGGAAGGGTIASTSSGYGPLAGGYGAATTEATVPEALSSAGLGGAAGAASMGPAAAAGAAGTGSGLWGALAKYVLPTAIPAVTGLIGGVIQANAADKALQAQTDAQNKALGLSQALYNARQQQIAPYVGTGRASLSKLADLMGLPADAQSYQPPQVNLPGLPASPLAGGTASLPPAVPPPTTSTSGPSSGMVTMRAPTGEVSQVPTNQVARAQQLGAVVVGS